MNPDLTALSPGTRTDLEILALEGSTIEQHDGYVVVRSPLQPRFHWGNCVHVTTGDVEDTEQWLSVFHTEFPDAPWVAIGLPRMPSSDSWRKAGFTPEGEDVLALTGMPECLGLPQGYSSRAFASADDWQQLLDMELAERAADVGSVSDDYAQFSKDRIHSRAALMEQGHLTWVGAFTPDGVLASSLGIAVLGDDRALARYQSVLTHSLHRRRGLAGHLLGVAATWAFNQGARDFVIVTELTNPAGRLYRSVGFTPAPSNVAIYEAPKE